MNMGNVRMILTCFLMSSYDTTVFQLPAQVHKSKMDVHGHLLGLPSHLSAARSNVLAG